MKFILSSQNLIYMQSFTILALALLILCAFKVQDFIRALTILGEKFRPLFLFTVKALLESGTF